MYGIITTKVLTFNCKSRRNPLEKKGFKRVQYRFKLVRVAGLAAVSCILVTRVAVYRVLCFYALPESRLGPPLGRKSPGNARIVGKPSQRLKVFRPVSNSYSNMTGGIL